MALHLDASNSLHEDSFSWTWDDNAVKLGLDAEDRLYRFRNGLRRSFIPQLEIAFSSSRIPIFLCSDAGLAFRDWDELCRRDLVRFGRDAFDGER